LTAREIGDELRIMPNAVYRAVRHLIDLGVVQQRDSHPVRYDIVPRSVAMGWFLMAAQQSFVKTFGSATGTQPDGVASMSVVKTRSGLLSKTDKDTALAKRSIDFIVSGLEVPKETILAYHTATKRGVKIRVLLQKRTDTSPDKLRRWLSLGAEIRLTSDMSIRMFIFDSAVVYLTSYSKSNKEEAFGLRFKYQPLAITLNDVFEQRWKQAEALQSLL
jgi:sugar-specific transcriptional regulator TrmB